ncbi:MAG: C2 domain-containing protein [Candidatus Thiothrix sulfatifontis]|nr:MAG: C2 domain-containing protein [Candidatus Thiothrix sulfatifontis]
MKSKLLIILLFIFPLSAYAGSTVKLTITQTKANGAAWDAFSGKPDPYIKIDGTSYRGSKCQDAFTCKFSIDETILEPITVEVWDADVSEDDSAGSTFCVPQQACSTGLADIIIY